MTPDGRTEAKIRTRRQEGTHMNTNALTARRRTATSPKGTDMTNIARTAAVLTTLLVLASHAFANDPSGQGTIDPYGAASPEPVTVRVEIVVYPFAALQDASAAHGVAQVDPYRLEELGWGGVASVDDLPYPMAALVSHSSRDAPDQVDPYAAATGQPQAPRVEVVVYPFAALQDASAAHGVAQVDPYRLDELGWRGVASVEELPYPMAGLVSRSSRDAPDQVDPYAAATGQTQAPRVVIFVYPFHDEGAGSD